MMFERGEQRSPDKSSESASLISLRCYGLADDLVFDKWLQDIDHYEETLSEMATASLDQNFKEELGAIEQWFRVLSEAERTSALYTLLNQATQVQIRFLIMVLQQQAQEHPLSDVLSPANFSKEAMNEKMAQASLQSHHKQAASPQFYRPGKTLDPSTIQQMFPDAAAALANQRAELNRKKNGQISVGTPTVQPNLTLPNNEELPRTPWTPSFRSALDPPTRPKSAEPSNSAGLKPLPHGTPLRSPRTDLNASSAPYSPFGESGSANWASMTNTPASSMFPQHSLSTESLQQRLAASDVPRSNNGATSFSNPRIVLESDVRKFRKPSRSPSGMEQVNFVASSPLMMYDDNGQLMSVQAAQQLTSPVHVRHQSLMGTPLNNSSAWQLVSSPANNGIYASSSPVLSMDNGYGSENSARRRSSQQKPVETPTDLRLLNDVPAWLRQLRLHKYTDNLKSMKWQDMVKMSDSDLEAKGVSALGARRKLLKAFETVNEAMGEKTT